MPTGGVVLNFLVKSADAVRDTNKLTDALGAVGSKGKDAAGSKGLGGLFKTLAIGVPIVGGVVAGVVGLAEGLFDATKVALEHERATSKMNDTLKRVPGITKKARDANEDWVEMMQLTTHVAGDEMKNAVGTLALATGDLAKAQDLASLAWDASVQSGKSFEEVVEAMTEATNGNAGALQEQFQWLKPGSDGVLTYAEAMEQLTDKTKGAAKAAADTDPWTTITTVWGLMKDKLATAVQPALTRLGDWFKKPANTKRIQSMLDKVSELGEQVGIWLLGKLEDLIKYIESPAFKRAVLTWKFRFQAMMNALGDFVTAVQATIGWVQDLVGWIGDIDLSSSNTGGGIRPGEQSVVGAGTLVSAQARAASVPYAAPTVIVTEEQVYRAVQKLLLRGDARNGRLVMAR